MKVELYVYSKMLAQSKMRAIIDEEMLGWKSWKTNAELKERS